MMHPKGIGYWIAFPKILGTVDQIVARLLEVGADWVAPRGSDGRHESKDWTRAHTRACVDAGIPVYRWPFSRPGDIHHEVTLAEKWRSEGDSGFIVDAETPWAGCNRQAEIYGSELRRVLGHDHFIADAPWPFVHYHPEYPWHAFEAFVAARMPQYYWTEIGLPFQSVCDTADGSWRRYNQSRPIYPIGVTYGAAELRRLGATPCPSEIVPTDVQKFVDRYRARGCVSLYSLEAANSEVLDLLKPPKNKGQEKIEPLPSFDSYPATPIGWELHDNHEKPG